MREPMRGVRGGAGGDKKPGTGSVAVFVKPPGQGQDRLSTAHQHRGASTNNAYSDAIRARRREGEGGDLRDWGVGAGAATARKKAPWAQASRARARTAASCPGRSWGERGVEWNVD